MKWLLDEMLPPATCRALVDMGHDALSVYDAGLSGRQDDEVFDFAVQDERLFVTENFADYATLLEQRASRDASVPVVFIRKSKFARRGALAVRLAKQLGAWARKHPDPYVGPHWARLPEPRRRVE
jgi:predicted nuclease of predicted toxin-antitoxin system